MKNKEWKEFVKSFSLDTREKMPDGTPSMILVWFGEGAGIKFNRKRAREIRDEITEWLNETDSKTEVVERLIKKYGRM